VSDVGPVVALRRDPNWEFGKPVNRLRGWIWRYRVSLGYGARPASVANCSSSASQVSRSHSRGYLRWWLYLAGFSKRGGRLACVYYDENALSLNAPNEIEGLASCLDYFRAVTAHGQCRIQAQYDKQFPGKIRFAGAATGMYRGLKLWG